MSGKLQDFLTRNQQNLREDAGERPAGNAPPAVSKLDGRTRMQNAAAIAVDRIVADAQTREAFDEDELKRLADSIRQDGQLQPILVRYDEGRAVYVIVAGERRWRACKLAGLPTVNAVVVEKTMTEAEILNVQILENALRQDLRPVEQAKAFAKAMQMNGWDGKTLAEQLHINPSTVSRSLALLKLPEDMQRRVDVGEVPPTVAIKQVTKETGRRTGNTASRKSGKPAKEHTLRLAGGVTVIVKGRRALSDEEVAAALEEALRGIRGDMGKSAA